MKDGSTFIITNCDDGAHPRAEGGDNRNARPFCTRRSVRHRCRRGVSSQLRPCPDRPATTQEAQQQPAEPAATTAPDPGEDTSTGEIVVTARRTEERLQRVPGSVSAFNERALDRIQAQDTTGLQGAVPNLNIVQGRGSSNATNIYIRGIGQPDALQTFDPAVGVYVDDVYLSRIRGTQLDLLDVERIEVLRGPQGTLYGKNTIGGAIKFVTRSPGQELHANASVAIGSYDQFEFKTAASGPLTETLSAGISLSGRSATALSGTILDRRYNDKDTVGAAAPSLYAERPRSAGYHRGLQRTTTRR